MRLLKLRLLDLLGLVALVVIAACVFKLRNECAFISGRLEFDVISRPLSLLPWLAQDLKTLKRWRRRRKSLALDYSMGHLSISLTYALIRFRLEGAYLEFLLLLELFLLFDLLQLRLVLARELAQVLDVGFRCLSCTLEQTLALQATS